MKPQSDLSDPRIVKALTHPLRARILATLEERTASPSELADEIGAPLGNVSYHVRQLAALKLIKLVKKTPRRGAIEHHYRAVDRSEISAEAWAKVPGIVKDAVIGGTLARVSAAVNAAASDGGFNSPDSHLSDTPFAVDDRGWREISKELARVQHRIEKIKGESSDRLAKAGQGGKRQVDVVLMLFEAEGAEDAEAPASSTASSGHAGGRRRRRAPATRARAKAV